MSENNNINGIDSPNVDLATSFELPGVDPPRLKDSLNKPKIIIVGAGPSGLTLAHYLSKYTDAHITIVDRENTIGGCHRVSRVPAGAASTQYPLGYFSEHGPRIYNSNYLNFRRLLQADLNQDFFDIFVPYHFSTAGVIGKSLGQFSSGEILSLIWEGLKLPFMSADHSESVLNFAKRHNFSPQAIDYLDRLCRLSDGAGADRYTTFEFFQMPNQHALYQIYQPKYPNDQLLFPVWQQYLEKQGVKFILGAEIQQLVPDANGQEIAGLRYIKLQNPINGLQKSTQNEVQQLSNIGSTAGKHTYLPCDLAILAIPPRPLMDLLARSQLPAIFQPEKPNLSLPDWTKQSSYFTYIPMTFHYHQKIKLPDVWGSPESDWGVARIILSDYFKNYKGTLITIAITRPKAISKYLQKTPNQCTKEELIAETYRQMLTSYPKLPVPDKAIVSPEMYRLPNDKVWKSRDQAFVLTKDGYLPAESGSFSNLYSLGSHNGHSPYYFTSMESAVANAVDLTHKLVPGTKSKLPILKPVGLTDVLLMAGLLMVLYYVLKKQR